ncbi:hypothetical protein [Paractinoplanes atraurantiacus]|uniref:Uncharacterized protein n=1 Tax=Paractinoplanes atraurantiacus TaxID=1036182 RepID=A0A285JVM2_9ACTN|nr:hypothetical protein [Actinoplanes atraurantiacus]SNY64328.1 hypothetical protein SAMN05421748_126105 [Actinoplanes atraurantiacus]
MSYRIEDVLESVQEGAPPPRTSAADIIAGARRIRSRRRWAAVAGAGGAAAVTVALVAGLTGAAPQAAPPDAPAAATTPSRAVAVKTFTQPTGLAFTIGETRVGKWTIGPAGAATYGYQQIPVHRDGKTIETDGVAYPYPDAMLTFYRPGVYDIKDFGVAAWSNEKYGPARNVTIAGRPGIERMYTYSLPDLADLRAKMKANPGLRLNDPSIKTQTFVRTAFAWKFDGSSWATFLPGAGREPLSRAESLAIVEAVRPHSAVPATIPYTFGWLPAGWKVIGAEQSPTDMPSQVLLDQRIPPGEQLAEKWDALSTGGRLTIWRGKPKTANAPRGGESMKCVDINGYCTLVIDGTHFAEFERLGKRLSMDDVRRILRGLTFTSVADQSRWKPVS